MVSASFDSRCFKTLLNNKKREFCNSMERQNGNLSRLEEWREIVSVIPELELDEVAAGRDAEHALRAMAKSHLTFKTASIFHSKRVPRLESGSARGRYEIDLIMVSPKQISAIEIKNWSGRLRVDGGKWIQERRNGEDVSHDDPLAKNAEKLDCLCSMLETRNIRVPKAQVSRVVFWNKNLNVPLEMAKREEIVMNHELTRFLQNQKATGFAEGFLMSVLELCLDQEKSAIAADGFFEAIPSGDYNASVKAISALETFDKVELFGGRAVSGDLLELRTSEGTHSLKSIPSGTEVRVMCKRNRIFLFFSALLGSKPLISLGHPLWNLSVKAGDKVLFHQVGAPKPKEIDIASIARMIRG